MRFCQNILLRFWVSFSQNLIFFHFSCHIILLMSRTVTIFLLTQRTRLDGPFKYLAHIHKVCWKFLRHKLALCRREKSVKIWLITDEITRQKKKRYEILKIYRQNWGWNILTNLIFWGETFSKAPTTFSVGFTYMFTISEKPPPNLDLWFDEKIVTAWHTNLITCQEITRTVEILNNEAKIKVEIFWKISFFVVRLRHYQNYLRHNSFSDLNIFQRKKTLNLGFWYYELSNASYGSIENLGNT